MLGCNKCLLLYRINPCLINNLQYYHCLYCHVCLLFSSSSPITAETHVFLTYFGQGSLFFPSVYDLTVLERQVRTARITLSNVMLGPFINSFVSCSMEAVTKKASCFKILLSAKKGGVILWVKRDLMKLTRWIWGLKKWRRKRFAKKKKSQSVWFRPWH